MTSDLELARYGDLAEKTVFISGGASGIGADLVEAFCRQGATTHFVDIDVPAAQAHAEALARATGRRPVFTRCDVTDSAALAACIDAAQAASGRLDVLINNAANDSRHEIEEVDDAAWDRMLAVNLRHQFMAAKAAFRHMRAAGRGSIVNFGSVAPLLGQRRLSVYSTAKSAVTGLTRSLAREYGDAGVRVNAIVPGAILTERQLALWIAPEDEARIRREQCLHRRLVGADVAQMALFLASDVSSACTSQRFVVDGGLT